jgi:hypothetical protein
MPPNNFLARSRVFPILSLDNNVKEAGLNENKLLNQDRLGETPELVDVAELGPDKEGMKGVGSMLERSVRSALSRCK